MVTVNEKFASRFINKNEMASLTGSLEKPVIP